MPGFENTNKFGVLPVEPIQFDKVKKSEITSDQLDTNNKVTKVSNKVSKIRRRRSDRNTISRRKRFNSITTDSPKSVIQFSNAGKVIAISAGTIAFLLITFVGLDQALNDGEYTDEAQQFLSGLYSSLGDKVSGSMNAIMDSVQSLVTSEKEGTTPIPEGYYSEVNSGSFLDILQQKHVSNKLLEITDGSEKFSTPLLDSVQSTGSDIISNSSVIQPALGSVQSFVSPVVPILDSVDPVMTATSADFVAGDLMTNTSMPVVTSPIVQDLNWSTCPANLTDPTHPPIPESFVQSSGSLTDDLGNNDFNIQTTGAEIPSRVSSSGFKVEDVGNFLRQRPYGALGTTVGAGLVGLAALKGSFGGRREDFVPSIDFDDCLPSETTGISDSLIVEIKDTLTKNGPDYLLGRLNASGLSVVVGGKKKKEKKKGSRKISFENLAIKALAEDLKVGQYGCSTKGCENSKSVAPIIRYVNKFKENVQKSLDSQKALQTKQTEIQTKQKFTNNAQPALMSGHLLTAFIGDHIYGPGKNEALKVAGYSDPILRVVNGASGALVKHALRIPVGYQVAAILIETVVQAKQAGSVNPKTIGKELLTAVRKQLGGIPIADVMALITLFTLYSVTMSNATSLGLKTSRSSPLPWEDQHNSSGHTMTRLLEHYMNWTVLSNLARNASTTTWTFFTAIVTFEAAMTAVEIFHTGSVCHTGAEIAEGAIWGLGIIVTSALAGRAIRYVAPKATIGSLASRAWNMVPSPKNMLNSIFSKPAALPAAE